MAFWMALINGGKAVYLTDMVKYGQVQIDGFGLPPVSNQLEQGPLQHGATWVDFRLGSRTITLTFIALANDFATQWARRAELLRLCQPGAELQLWLSYDNRVSYYIAHGYVSGGLSFSTADTLAFNLWCTVTLTCPDPTWHSYWNRYGDMWMGDSAGTAIPTTIPSTDSGTGAITRNEVIQYPGTWDSYPEIMITGPITNPLIMNDTTGEVLDFTGYTLAAGHYIRINLNYGYKTVLLDDVTNLIGELTDASDLATWHLEKCESHETVHSNSITVTGSACTGATNLFITYFERYIGI